MATDPDHVQLYRAALNDLEAVATDNIDRWHAILERIEWIRAELAQGRTVAELAADEESPALVEILTRNIDGLHTLGAQFRATHAHALRSEGLTLSAIAELFGLTRQRISAMLRQKSAPET